MKTATYRPIAMKPSVSYCKTLYSSSLTQNLDMRQIISYTNNKININSIVKKRWAQFFFVKRFINLKQLFRSFCKK